MDGVLPDAVWAINQGLTADNEHSVTASVITQRAGLQLLLKKHYLLIMDREFIFLLIGEIIDRCEFYSELKIQTPQSQINEDLVEELKIKSL